MQPTVMVGKREFIQHTSEYLKQAERGIVVITHHHKPMLKLTCVHEKSIYDLRGLIKKIEIIGDINDHELSDYDQW